MEVTWHKCICHLLKLSHHKMKKYVLILSHGKINYCVIWHNMKFQNFKRSYLTHYVRYDLKISQMLDSIVIYHLTQYCQCHTSVHVMRWNGHIFTIVTMMSAGRQMTSNDMISKYKIHYLHHLHGHILHNLSNIALYGKNLFLALTDLIMRVIPPELNFE